MDLKSQTHTQDAINTASTDQFVFRTLHQQIFPILLNNIPAVNKASGIKGLNENFTNNTLQQEESWIKRKTK